MTMMRVCLFVGLICVGALPVSVVADTHILIATATAGGASWRYTFVEPDEGWKDAGFDDREWRRGKAGFGVKDHATPSSTIGTAWTTPSIWLRKTIDLASLPAFKTAGIIVRHDEDVDMYINGRLVFAIQGFNTEWIAYDITAELRKALKPGANVVAVHVKQTGGGQYIDLGLELDPARKLIKQTVPVAPAEWRELRKKRWPQAKAWQWYHDVGPIVGCNYLPRTAVNMTEMWQSESFDPQTIDEELGWAAAAGYNSLRVFVQYLVWHDDPEGLKERLDKFLAMADKHAMRVVLTPFCDCAFAGREPYLGKQDEPVSGVHNSGWVPSPGLKRVLDQSTWPDLERYIKDLVGAFGKDQRVLIWDLYNEPGQSGLGEQSLPLVAAAFRWSREAGATQPLTVGAWADFDSGMSKSLMELSDVVSFHGYDDPSRLQEKIRICSGYHRPILCTEWLRRQHGNTFESVLPLFARWQIGGYHWGLVAGRTQTFMPWGSQKGDPPPEIWQHDVMHADGEPFRAAEFQQLEKFRKDYLRFRPWSPAKARQWYAQQPWPCGLNYIPANAISYTEMWMPYCFDAKLIDRELELAEAIGFNCVRIVLPFVVWEHDPKAFKQRLEEFLRVCEQRGIKVMFTFFDDCAFGSDDGLKNPKYGQQPQVLKGWYANGWTPSPGHDMVRDANTWPRLETYVKDIVSAFGDDSRVWVWDLYNEPTNGGLGDVSIPLVEKVFQWAREVQPSQPLTVGQWNGNSQLNRVIYAYSDIITFHEYGEAERLSQHIEMLRVHGRPIINTEWLNRGRGSLVETCLPLFAKTNVGCLHWGLVNGKTQTHLAWGWRPGMGAPKVWQHDLFNADHQPYRPEELELFRKWISTKKGVPSSPTASGSTP